MMGCCHATLRRAMRPAAAASCAAAAVHKPLGGAGRSWPAYNGPCGPHATPSEGNSQLVTNFYLARPGRYCRRSEGGAPQAVLQMHLLFFDALHSCANSFPKCSFCSSAFFCYGAIPRETLSISSYALKTSTVIREFCYVFPRRWGWLYW
jgi:hypothetical protein